MALHNQTVQEDLSLEEGEHKKGEKDDETDANKAKDDPSWAIIRQDMMREALQEQKMLQDALLQEEGHVRRETDDVGKRFEAAIEAIERGEPEKTNTDANAKREDTTNPEGHVMQEEEKDDGHDEASKGYKAVAEMVSGELEKLSAEELKEDAIDLDEGTNEEGNDGWEAIKNEEETVGAWVVVDSEEEDIEWDGVE